MRIFRAIALIYVVSLASIAAFILGAWIVTTVSRDSGSDEAVRG